MAVLVPSQAIDTTSFEYVTDLFANATFINNGAARFTVRDATFPYAELRFDGANFVYGSDTIPDSGTITRVRARYDEDEPGPGGFSTVWDVQDLNLSVADLYALVAQGSDAVVKAVFAGDDELNGSDDGDFLQGHGGNDSYFGSLGDDTYYYDDAGDRLVSLTEDGLDVPDEGFDTIVATIDARIANGVERLILAGEEDIDATGRSGDDRLLGNEGDNVINGRTGQDLLWGKGGADTFRFDVSGDENRDIVMDFVTGVDKIELDQTEFDGLALGGLKNLAFKDIGKPGAKIDSTDRVIYNSDYGTLFYDADGKGGEARVLIAQFENEPAITAGDILVV